MFSLIVFLPLFASICVGVYGYRLGTKGVALLTLLSLFSAALLAFWYVLTTAFHVVPVYINLFS